MQRRTYDIYSDGSRRNESAWSDTSTCYNRTPSVSDLAIASDEDTQAQGTIAVSDDHTSFTYQIVSAPPAGAGTASFSGNKIVFSPVANWNGATSLTYRAQDPAGAWSNVATASITIRPVNDAPVAQDKTLALAEDSVASVSLTATDIDSPAPSVFQLVQLPPAAAGQLALSGNVATFKPSADWNGSTSFTYRAQDSAGAWSAPATVQITVTPVNDAPVVRDATLTTAEDTPGSIELSATDIDSPAPSRFEIVTAPAAAAGTAAIQRKTLSFTPAPDWNGSTALTYRAQDDAGAWSAPATIRISVTPVNDAPVAQQKTLALDEDSQASVQLTATDIDSPTPTVFELVALPQASVGQVTLAGATATFNPAKDLNGTTQFTYRAQDSAGAWSAPAAVAVTVRPVNDTPALTDVTLEIRTKESVPVTTRARVLN
nr:Ig-like domain-containing protein [Pseudomonas psychrotolerans]